MQFQSIPNCFSKTNCSENCERCHDRPKNETIPLMKTELSFTPLAEIATELLAVLAVDTQTAKGPRRQARARAADLRRGRNRCRSRRARQRRIQGRRQRNAALHAPAGLDRQAPADRRPRQAGQSHGPQRAQRCRNRRPLHQAPRHSRTGLRSSARDPPRPAPRGQCARRRRRRLSSATSTPTPIAATART